MTTRLRKAERRTKVRVKGKVLEMGGTYDFFDEKDRWQLLSKELQQK